MDKIDFKDVHSLVGVGMVIDGTVVLKGGLIVYGKINGDVTTTGPVRVARHAEVTGNIKASDIHINGYVRGDVEVTNRAVLGSKAMLVGDLVYRSLLIEEGAHLEGKCDLLPGAAPQPEAVTAEALPEDEETEEN